MTSNIKVGGAWKSSTALSVKVGGAWKGVATASVKIGGAWKTWLMSMITDTFSRTTSSGLGTADTGQTWTNLVSGWTANGTSATTSTSGSLATIAFKQDVSVSADVSPGIGPTFWATSAGSFWSATPWYQTGTYTYGCCNGSSSCFTSSSCTPSNCCGAAFAVRRQSWSYTCVSSGGSSGAAGSSGGYLNVSVAETCSQAYSRIDAGCNGGILAGSWSCDDTLGQACDASGTCSGTSYKTYIRVYDKNTNTTYDSLVNTNNGGTYTTLASILAVTSGNSVTVTGYTGAGKTGTAYVYTPTIGIPTKGSGVGLYQTSAGTATQGTTADTFSAS